MSAHEQGSGAKRFFDACDGVLARIRQTQSGKIAEAAEAMAKCAAGGGALHLYDRGHAWAEAMHRAAGLAGLNPLMFGFHVSTGAPPCHQKRIAARGPAERSWCIHGLAAEALKRANVFPGDCVLINCMFGNFPDHVELARECKKLGVTTIAILSVEFSKACPPLGGMDKKLMDVADIVIDNCSPVGDGILDFPGIPVKACPTSNIASYYIIWALTAEFIQRMIARGITPTVLKSVNLPDGEEYNRKAMAEYARKGI